MNELASFNFFIHYKPGMFPTHKDGCISEYSELCDAGEIKSILDAAVYQKNNNESWIPPTVMC